MTTTRTAPALRFTASELATLQRGSRTIPFGFRSDRYVTVTREEYADAEEASVALIADGAALVTVVKRDEAGASVFALMTTRGKIVAGTAPTSDLHDLLEPMNRAAKAAHDQSPAGEARRSLESAKQEFRKVEGIRRRAATRASTRDKDIEATENGAGSTDWSADELAAIEVLRRAIEAHTEDPSVRVVRGATEDRRECWAALCVAEHAFASVVKRPGRRATRYALIDPRGREYPGTNAAPTLHALLPSALAPAIRGYAESEARQARDQTGLR